MRIKDSLLHSCWKSPAAKGLGQYFNCSIAQCRVNTSISARWSMRNSWLRIYGRRGSVNRFSLRRTWNRIFRQQIFLVKVVASRNFPTKNSREVGTVPIAIFLWDAKIIERDVIIRCFSGFLSAMMERERESCLHLTEADIVDYIV